MAEEYLTDDEQLEARQAAVCGIRPLDDRRRSCVGAGLVLRLSLLPDQHQNERALKAAAQFSAHDRRARRPTTTPKSRQIADGLIKDYPSSPYADQAQLTLARLDVDDRQAARPSRR